MCILEELVNNMANMDPLVIEEGKTFINEEEAKTFIDEYNARNFTSFIIKSNNLYSAASMVWIENPNALERDLSKNTIFCAVKRLSECTKVRTV